MSQRLVLTGKKFRSQPVVCLGEGVHSLPWFDCRAGDLSSENDSVEDPSLVPVGNSFCADSLEFERWIGFLKLKPPN